jgi:hypothetical protein
MSDKLKQIKPGQLKAWNEKAPDGPVSAFVLVPLAEFDGYSGFRAFALAYEERGRIYWFGNVDGAQLMQGDGYRVDFTDAGYVRIFPVYASHKLQARGSVGLRIEVVR